MSIRDDLRTYVLSKSSVTDLIGQRMYPQESPQAEPGATPYPRVVYRENGGQRTGSLEGANPQVRTAFSLDCQSKNGDEAVNIANALSNILDYFQGTMNGTTVQGVFVTRGPDSIDPPIDGNEKGVRTSTIDIDLWYESAVPTYV